VDAPAPTPRLRLTGLVDAWDRADGIGRRELLGALFVELDISEGKFWRCRPQPDVADELLSHLREWEPVGPQLNSETGVPGVAPAGFEPAVSALRGLRPRPLDDGAVRWWAALGLNQ
jgi:hypothetical protein